LRDDSARPSVSRCDRRAQYLDREIEIARHAADDRELLEILLAEDCDIGLHLIEQLGDDGRDAVEMAGPCGAVQ
jgi:hypothetical protein